MPTLEDVIEQTGVTSHTGCVSRNLDEIKKEAKKTCHIPHGMCEQKSDIICCIDGEKYVTSHTGCVSRNLPIDIPATSPVVTSHTGCVSRNLELANVEEEKIVTSHTGCVSRNDNKNNKGKGAGGHIPHGMCEQKFYTP